jgi:hypothetical protein
MKGDFADEQRETTDIKGKKKRKKKAVKKGHFITAKVKERGYQGVTV